MPSSTVEISSAALPIEEKINNNTLDMGSSHIIRSNTRYETGGGRC